MALESTIDLPAGTKMPLFGLGMWQVTDGEEVRRAIETSLDQGYKLIDTARVYQNEAIIGQVLQDYVKSGKRKREDLFITSKVALHFMGSQDLLRQCLDLTLKELQVEYLDLLLIHFPCGFKFTGDYDGWPRDENGKLMWIDADFISVWKAMEEFVDEGRVKAIGLSNFNMKQIERVQAAARIPISNLQVELHAYFQQVPLVEFCRKHGITVTAYAPLGSPGRESIKTGKFPVLLQDDVLAEIAAAHKKTPAQVAMRFLLQQDIAIVPKSVTPSRIVENSQIFDFSLSDDEMARLKAIDRNLRTFMFEISEGQPEHPF